MAGTTINPYRFGGQLGYRRDGANRSYVRARHLDTQRGRWISRDPIGLESGDSNLYRYVMNAPVTRVDPSGKEMPWTEPGCKDAAVIKKALFKACSVARECKCPPLSSNLRFCLKNLCAGVEANGLGYPIKCGFPNCDKLGICAEVNPFGLNTQIELCPKIMFTPGCGCSGKQLDPVTQVALNLLHEMLHLCWVGDMYLGPPWTKVNPAQKIAGQCFGLTCVEPGYPPLF